MLTDFLCLLLLTGKLEQVCVVHAAGIISSYSTQPALPDDQQKSNQSFEEAGSPSNYSQLELQQNFSQSSEEDGESSTSNCSYLDLLKHLDLKKDGLRTMTRPVKNHKKPLQAELSAVLYGIIDVREKQQEFVSYICVLVSWRDEYIYWDPDDFCGIEMIYIPTEVLWTPDPIIQEMTKKDEGPSGPYLGVWNEGSVIFKKYMVVVSTCKFQLYKFPFDVQSCNLTFKSAIHLDTSIQFDIMFNSSDTTAWSVKFIQTQSEWLFISMTVSNKTFQYQSNIIYTITMKRRSNLYIANFILPILFFMCLDLASFMIADTGGEKLSFKITVLLAVTVMQLILNDILPSSSDRIPLIAVYCIGMFGLMMLSLLETIVVMHLMEKDSAPQDNEADEDQSLSEDCGEKQSKVSFHSCFRGKMSSDRLPVAKEGSSSQLTEECNDSKKLSDELSEAVKTLTLVHLPQLSDELREVTLLLSSRKEHRKPGYWTRMTKKINKVFFTFYIIVASVFLFHMFIMWSTEEDNNADISED